MEQPRPKNRVLKIFDGIGYQLEPVVGDVLFSEAAENEFGPHSDMCSINAFRSVLNEYLRAVDNDCEDQWREEHGL